MTMTVLGCMSPVSTTTVIVNTSPSAPTASNSGPVCAGGTLNLGATGGTGVTFSWTGPNGFSSLLQNPVLNSVTTNMSGVYSVTASLNGCVSAPSTTTVLVNAIPTAPVIGNNGPVCAGSSLNLTSAPMSGVTYQWSGPNGFGSNQPNPVIPNANITMTGSYQLMVSMNGCTSSAAMTSATVNGVPAAPVASNNSPFCAGNTLNLGASAISGAVYNWSGPNGFSSNVQNPVINNAQTVNAGVYTVYATVNGCSGPMGSTTVSVNPNPTAVFTGNNGPLCEGSSLNLTATSISGVSYSWSGPNGFTSVVQNPVLNSADRKSVV